LQQATTKFTKDTKAMLKMRVSTPLDDETERLTQVIELKAVRRFEPIHEAQLISYLRTTGLRAGLLLNFSVPLLRDGLKRVVL
jgi:hypothetical protein